MSNSDTSPPPPTTKLALIPENKTEVAFEHVLNSSPAAYAQYSQARNGVVSKKRRLVLQSPAAPVRSHVEFSPRPSALFPFTSPLGLRICTPMKFTLAQSQGLVDPNQTPVKKIDWSILPAAPMSSFDNEHTKLPDVFFCPPTPNATRIFSSMSFSEHRRMCLLISMAFCHLTHNSFDEALEYFVFSLHQLSLSTPTMRDSGASVETLAYMCFLCIWKTSTEHSYVNIQLRAPLVFATWFFAIIRSMNDSRLISDAWMSLLSRLPQNETSVRYTEICEGLEKLFPANIENCNNSACVALFADKTSTANSLLQVLATAHSQNALVLNNYACTLLRLKQYKEAVFVLNIILSIQGCPEYLRIQARNNQYVALVALGDVKAASEIVRHFVADTSSAHHSLLHINFASHLIASASHIDCSIVQRDVLRQAKRVLLHLISSSTTSTQSWCPSIVYVQLGKVYALQAQQSNDESWVAKLQSRASHYFMMAIRLVPNNPTPWNEFGRLALSVLDFAKAERILSSVLSKNLNHIGALCNYAMTLHLANKLSQAKTVYQQILVLDPNCVAAWNNLGCLFRSLQQIDMAKTAFEKSLQLNPRSTNARCNLALLSIVFQDYTHALLLLQEAASIDPGNTCVQSNLIKLRWLIAHINQT